MTFQPAAAITSKRINALRQSGLLELSGSEQFGHLTDLVRDVLDVPVAIVSLVDEDRQVFAGHSGLPEPWAGYGETPISHSFCLHVVEQREPLVVTDASRDPLVRDNPAIGDIGVAAYLGVPITLPNGELVGALAAIDTVPRVWTDADMRRLGSIARMVESEIAVRISEGHWRSLFENMQEGYYIARAIRDDVGVLTDVEFEEANPAVERVTGLRLASFVGARLSGISPDGLVEMLPVYERVLMTGTPEVFVNSQERLGRWFENRIRRLDEMRIAAIVTDVSAKRKAEQALARSEARWRNLFAELREGFIVGRLVRDEAGNIVDWRYEEVNRAWGDLFGVPSETALGRTVREVFPGMEDDGVMEFADVVLAGQPKVFFRQVGTTGRWYEGRAEPQGEDTFIVLFLEITERVSAEAALRISQAQLATLVESMPVGVMLAETTSGRIVMSNSRMAQIMGVAPDQLGDDFDYSRFVSYDEDGSLFNADNYPLARIMAGEALHHAVEVHLQRPDGSRVWIEITGEAILDQSGKIVAAALLVTDTDERRRAEASQRLLNSELAHRIKNSLAMVQAIVSQTLRTARDITDGRRVITDRLAALARAQDVLTGTHWDAADILELVEGAIAPHRTDSARVEISGPRATLDPQQAMGIALAIHELSTNAVKYGALSNATGKVSVRWDISDNVFTFTWIETGGPEVAPPEGRGFGSKLIEQIAASYFDGTGRIAYEASGIEFRLKGVLVRS